MRLFMVDERVVSVGRPCRGPRAHLARSIITSVIGIAMACIAMGDDSNPAANPAPVSAPGGGEMVLLAPGADHVLHGRLDDSGQVKADCAQDLPQSEVANSAGDANE